MNKRDKGITEVKTAPLILFNLSSEQIISDPGISACYQSFMMITLFSNIIKFHRLVKKGFYLFLVNFGVRRDKPLNKRARLKNTHFVIVKFTQSYFF